MSKSAQISSVADSGHEDSSNFRRLSAPARHLGMGFGRIMSFLGNGVRRGANSVIDKPKRLANRRRAQHRGSAQQLDVQLEEAEPAQQQSGHPLQRLSENVREGLQRQQVVLSSHLQDSAQFLQRCMQKPSASSTSYLAANCFPPRLITGRGEPKFGVAENEQSVVCQGSRSFFNLKIYDFAIFLDGKQAKQSQLGRKYAGPGSSEPRDGRAELKLAQGIRDSRDVEMSLMVRASRNLPIILLTNEYKRILERRLQVVGGSKSDPALREMLSKFSEQALPEDIKQGGSVKKGTVIAFSRNGKGGVRAWANGHDLVEVQSEKLARAVFDIYLGETVVCKAARSQAGDNFIRMLGSEELPAPQDCRICRDDACRVGRLK